MSAVLHTSTGVDAYNSAQPFRGADVLFDLHLSTGGEMGQTVFVFRHAKSVKNLNVLARRALETGTADADMGLSNDGWEEIRMLLARAGKHLANRGLRGKVRIIHSPYLRTRITAECIAKSIGREEGMELVDMKPDSRLGDHNNGWILGLTHEEAREKYPEYARAMDKHPHAYLDAVPPGGESKRRVIERVRSFRNDLQNYKEHMVLVTHFDIVACLIALAEEEAHGASEKFDDSLLGMLSDSGLWNSTASLTEFERTADGVLALRESFQKLW